MLAASCTETDELISADNQVRINTIYSGNGDYATRTVENSMWDKGNQIGVFMMKNDNTLAASNVMFATNTEESNTTAIFKSEEGITLINDKVKFFAYYPYAATQNSTTYTINVGNFTDLTSLEAKDLRYASETKDLTSEALTSLRLKFSHQLTYLKVNVRADEDVTVKSVTVSGVNTQASFDLANGTLSEEQTGTSQLAKLENLYAGLVVPTPNLNNMKLEIVAQKANETDKVYTYNYNSSLSNGFQAGYQYLFNITLYGTTTPEPDTKVDVIESTLDGFIEGNDNTVEGETGDGIEKGEEEVVPQPSESIQVAANASYDDVVNLLADKTGNVTLEFAAGEYDLNKTITLPEGITGITFKGASANRTTYGATLNMSDLRWDGKLKELKFENVEVAGNGKSYFISDKAQHGEVTGSGLFDAGAVVEIKDCYFHNIKRLIPWRGNKDIEKEVMASFKIENSRMEGVGEQLLDSYAAAQVVLSKSTFYNWSLIAKVANKNAAFNVQDCTLVNTINTALECGGDGSITYNRNISIIISEKNLIFNLSTATTATGNYTNDGEKMGFAEGFTVKTTEELLPNLSSTGDNQFVPADGISAGDPRWYNK